MGKEKLPMRAEEKAKAFVELLYERGDRNAMAKLYDILYWGNLSDTEALARTELWQELERSLGNPAEKQG